MLQVKSELLRSRSSFSSRSSANLCGFLGGVERLGYLRKSYCRIVN